MNSCHYGSEVGSTNWGLPPSNPPEAPPVPQIRGQNMLSFTNKDIALCPYVLTTEEKAYDFHPTPYKKKKKTIFSNRKIQDRPFPEQDQSNFNIDGNYRRDGCGFTFE